MKLYAGLYLQLLLIVFSIFGLVGYFYSYKIGKKYETIAGSESIRKWCKFFFIFGASTCYIWIAMSFVHQPRFPGIVEALTGRKVSVIGLLSSLYGLLLLIIFGYRVLVATGMNWKVTLDNYDYLKPQRLLTSGPYGIVRHPMVISTFFVVFSVALTMGAYYTLMLMPIYFILNDALNWIQKKYVLEVEFAEEYGHYKKTTPRILNWWLSLLLGTGVLAVITNFILVPIKIG
jgi:protein-S-isoprenylcysteine O-methyltransferase Ste14